MEDTWRNESKTQLTGSRVFEELRHKCLEDPAGPQVLSLVDDAAYYAYQRTKVVLRHMGEFTLHDGDHVFQVLRLMEPLIGIHNLKSLSVPELMLLVLSALFHDIGMAPAEQDVVAWKKLWDSSETFESPDEEQSCNAFKRHAMAIPEKLEAIDDLVSQGRNSNADLLKSYLISDYIRETHALRAREIIQKDWANRIKYRETDLSVELAEICFSHNEDALSLLDLDMHYLCGQGQFVCLPLIGVLLRIADVLDFDPKRTPDILFSNLDIKNPISLTEWKKHRSIEAWIIRSDLIQFHAKCRHPAIEYSIHQFCDLIDRELSACNNVLSQINQLNALSGVDLKIELPYKVDRSKIETKKDIYGKPEYIYRETRFSLNKNQVVDLLMGTKLYGDPEVALRELLQNSIDACLLRQAMEKNWGDAYKPLIKVSYVKEGEEDILEVDDNGTGMDQYIIDKYYTKIGTSFYKSADFYDLKSQAKADFQPTSRFGIGILSCFMVSDTLIVDTRRVYEPHSSSEPIHITVEGQDSIFWITHGERKTPGTTTRLILRKNRNPWESLSSEQFIKSVENVIPNPPFEIRIDSLGKETIRDESSFGNLHAVDLKNHSWNEHENIRELSFSLDDKANGIVGSATVALLESQGRPVSHVGIQTKKVTIDGESYDLDKSIKMIKNEIELHSTSISIDDEGNIDSSSGYSTLARSQSRVSLHGIEIPTTLFPESWRLQRNQAHISWPFPLLIVVDICGLRDLDLNSSRNQILYGEKWINFEQTLAILVCKEMRTLVDVGYWNELKTLLLGEAKSEHFLAAVKSLE